MRRSSVVLPDCAGPMMPKISFVDVEGDPVDQASFAP